MPSKSPAWPDSIAIVTCSGRFGLFTIGKAMARGI